jgi:hypothetical protein
MARTKGWRMEPARHSLAAKGIKSRGLTASVRPSGFIPNVDFAKRAREAMMYNEVLIGNLRNLRKSGVRINSLKKMIKFLRDNVKHWGKPSTIGGMQLYNKVTRGYLNAYAGQGPSDCNTGIGHFDYILRLLERDHQQRFRVLHARSLGPVLKATLEYSWGDDKPNDRAYPIFVDESDMRKQMKDNPDWTDWKVVRTEMIYKPIKQDERLI